MFHFKFLKEIVKKKKKFSWKKTRSLLNEEDQIQLTRIDKENKRDLISAFAFSWIFQISLFLAWIFLVIGEVLLFFGYLTLLISSSMGLYYFWFRHLKQDNSFEIEVETKIQMELNEKSTEEIDPEVPLEE